MELRALRAFVEVVRQGGFTAATKTLFATQSTVSKAVKQLETEIGAPLLDRLGHGTRLTAVGEVVFRRAQRLLAERDDLAAEIAALRGLERGVLRLGLPPVGSGLVFAPLFARFRQLHPGIDITLTEHGSARLEEILRAGEIDFAALLLPVTEEFDWLELCHEPLMAILPAGHKLAGRLSLTMGDFRDASFILFESGFALNRIIVGACHRAGFEPRVTARSSQIDFIVELAAAGLGVAFLPRLIGESKGGAAISRILLDEPETDWRFALAWRRGAYLSDAARAWLALVGEAHHV